MSAIKLYAVPVIGFVLMVILQIGYAQQQQPMPPSPLPQPPSNVGTAIDQGIAYLLLLAALVITYLIH
ncbi:arabinogalactan protein 16 [Euphorbia peplus]|nr:arabinogalactan protein 16 [Euphorbia peplus]